MAARDPARARGAFASIEETGREALNEMRLMLGVLRRGDEDLALAPQPSLARVGALVERARQSGLGVDLHVEGEPTRLASGIDLAAFRVVEEALTNSLRHDGAGRARVTVRYGPRDLELEIADDGEAVDGDALTGMRERVALFGGQIEAAQGDDGFALRVRLPKEAVAT
jgi:signal transduction histidine kinase